MKRGDRVAIIGDPLPEWLMCDLAAQCLGAISYGLYPTSSRDEVAFVLRHGGASVLIAEDQEHVDKVLPLVGQLPDLRKLVVIDDSSMFGYADPALMSLNDLIGLSASVAGGPEEYLRLCRAVRPDDPATIVYTSGTSANPKGAVYTHRALITQGHQFFAFRELTTPEVFRSVVHLPLNHLYERMNTPLGMLVKGIVPHFGDEAERRAIRNRTKAGKTGTVLLEALGFVAKMRDDPFHQHAERRIHAFVQMIERQMNDAAENLWRRQFRKCKELVTLGDQRPVRRWRLSDCARARRVDDGCGIIRTNRAAEAEISSGRPRRMRSAQ